ncbi:MAG: LLM class flavin-dependent oxidoreductase [Pseudooceanicola nanhaiensis]|uniref:LLM class flavin-dependent oxidoreductase n=1 Tax=Rhodobacterales TaxID=204455 RepID=UPI00405A288C
MKLHWFAEASYPKLPPDFHQTGESSWVTTPISRHEPFEVGEMTRMFIRLMQQADREGFDGLAVNEHHQTPFALTPSPNLLAATLANTTENAAIVIIGDSIALYNPPVRVAEEVAWIDCLSNGRVVSGFVFGTPMDSIYCYGVPPVELRERFQEARHLIEKAWAEKEPFSFNGKYTKLRYVNVWPRPVQKKPPVWVPGSGSVETWDLSLENDYCYGQLSFSGLHSAKPLVDAFWEHAVNKGYDPNPYRLAFTQLICCAETDKEAEEKYSEAVKYFYRNRYVHPGFQTAPGYRTAKSMQSMAKNAKATDQKLSPEIKEKANRGELDFWEYDKHGFIIAGTPERVRQRIEDMVKELRIGQLIGCLHMGDLSEETASMNTHLMGTRVQPHLRNLWSEYEDHWTPKKQTAQPSAGMQETYKSREHA